ncbi:hypothetical protein KKH3_40740 [Pectobacterium actinidiae]|nr:hypothetical protein KKH3_40740 [Pectobacterium actinidiae]
MISNKALFFILLNRNIMLQINSHCQKQAEQTAQNARCKNQHSIYI